MKIEQIKLPPSNIDAERAIIWILITYDDSVFYDLRLKSDHFFDEHLSKIYSIISSIKSKWNTIDINMIISSTDNDRIKDIVYDISSEIYSLSNVKTYEEEIYSCYVRRNIIRGMWNVIADCYENNDLSLILSKLSKASDFWALTQNKKFSECAIDIAMNIWENKNFISTYWFSDLDKILWWYIEWQLVIIWARPWVWKTLVWCNLIDSIVKRWVSWCFFTLEMTSTEISKRIIAKWAWVSMRAIDSDESCISKVHEETWKVLETWYDFDIVDWLFDYYSICVEIKRQAIKNWVKVVYIDYLWLIDYADWSRTDNTVYAVSQITKWMKRLAKEMWITIVMLCQLNRDWANWKPNKAQLRSSWSIEQDADVIMLLYQNYDDELHKKYIEFIVDKNRNWIESSVYLWVDKRTMSIYDVDQNECVHF